MPDKYRWAPTFRRLQAAGACSKDANPAASLRPEYGDFCEANAPNGRFRPTRRGIAVAIAGPDLKGAAFRRCPVIDGFKIEVTSDELVQHLDERIRHHHDRATTLDAKARQVEVRVSPADDEEEEHLAMCWPGYVHDLERRATRHRSRELFLIFARDRIAHGEIYRLSEQDLKAVEWLPTEDSARFSEGF